MGAFSGRAWGEVGPSTLFLWGPQCARLRAQVTCSCLILGKGIIESEPEGGKSSGMNQAGNPVKAAKSAKPAGSNEAARGLCSLGCSGALLMVRSCGEAASKGRIHFCLTRDDVRQSLKPSLKSAPSKLHSIKWQKPKPS